ncbi:hypothetical protein ACSSS7_003335 [Eimeria intestinalis]
MALPQQPQGGQQHLLTMGLQQGQGQQQPGTAPAAPSQAATTQQQRLQFPQHQLPGNLHVQQQLLRMQQQQGITAKLQGVAAASGVQQRLLHLEQQEQFLQQQQQEPEKVHWVQCDRCDKWRVAPYEITLPSWVCEQNTWDRRYASCSVPEQPDPAAQMQQQQSQQARHQQQFVQQQQLQQQQLLQQQRLAAAGAAAPKPKAKAKAKAKAPAKAAQAVQQRPVQGGSATPEAASTASAATDLPLAPGLIPPAAAAASAAANVQQSLLHQQLGQQQQRGGTAAAGNLPALQQQLLQHQLQHQMQQAQQHQLLQQLQQQQHQLLQQLQQQPAVVFDNWVQCDACNKWRRALNPITSDKWYCRMNTWAPQYASCDAPEEPDPAQQDQQQQQNQQRLLEAAAALQRQQQQLQQNSAKRQRTASVSRAPEAAKVDPKASPPTQLLRQQQLVAAAAASGQRSGSAASPQQQLQVQQQLQQAKLTQAQQQQQQQQQHPGASASTGTGGQLQQLQLLQQQQLQLLQQQQVRLLDAARRATPNSNTGASGTPASGAPAAAAATGERREGTADAVPDAPERAGKWLECRSCKKWRRLPPDVDAEALRPKFFCYLNMWDPQHNSCSCPQEPWPQLQQQQQQELQAKAVPAAAVPAAAGALQKTQNGPSDANRQDKAYAAGATAAQQALPRTPGQLQGETSAAASIHQQLQEQQLLLLRMQQQQRAAATSASAANNKPVAAAAGAAAAGTEEDDDDGEEDIEETDRGGNGGPPGGAGAGGASSGGAAPGPGTGGAGGTGAPAHSASQGHPTAGSFTPAVGGGGTVAASDQQASDAVLDSGGSCCQDAKPAGPQFFDVLIVGGGVAGLAGALHCERAGVHYQLLEARDRLGGRVWPIKLPPAEGLQQRRCLRRGGRGEGNVERDGSVWVDGGANYMHGLTGNENDVRLKPRRKGCSVYHLATASPECRVAVVAGGTGWENPYYFDWLAEGRRICLFVVSLAHALFSRLATPISLTAGEQPAGSSLSILALLRQEAASLLKTDEAGEVQAAAAAASPCLLPDSDAHQCAEEGGRSASTFESLALPSGLRWFAMGLLNRLKELCGPTTQTTKKQDGSATELSVGECCACHVEGMVVRMLRSRFGFAAPLGDASAVPFAFSHTAALKRDVRKLHNRKTKLLACAQKSVVSCGTVYFRRICMSWRWLLDMLQGELPAYRLRLGTRVSMVSVCDSQDPAFPCLVRCHSEKNSGETQELRSKFVLVALPVTLLQQPEEGDERATARVTFHPPLAAEKLNALAAVGMGVHNKVVLRVAASDVFWSHAAPNFSSPHSRFQYLNLHAYGKTGCILAHLFPPVSLDFDCISDEQVAQEVLDDLRKLFGYAPRPALIAFVVTRWHSDRYSRGSYSYPKPGADMGTHWRWLRAPHPLRAPRIAFAGEYCSDSYNQCVDGAFDTGMRAAQSVVQFGLRRHPCMKTGNHDHDDSQSLEVMCQRERLMQQHRNRRQQSALKNGKALSRQPPRRTRGRKATLPALEARARIAATRTEMERTRRTYCGDACCPPVDCPDSTHAGYYLTDGSDLTDMDEGAEDAKTEADHSSNTRLMLEKFQALLRFNCQQLERRRSRYSQGSGASAFMQRAQARA